jgi:malonate transporter
MAFGVIARKLKLLEHRDSLVLSKFAVFVALPALVLSSLITKPFSLADIALPSLYWLVQGVALLCVFALRPLLKFDRATTGAAILSTFGNTGFIGYPIANAIFPGKMPLTILIDQLGMSIILYGTIGFIGARYGETGGGKFSIRHEAKELARKPIFIALLIGLILHFAVKQYPAALGIHAFSVTLASVALLGTATIPVIMTAVGMRLSAGHARKFLPLIAVFGLVKMVIMPVAAWAIGRTLYHLSGDTLGDCVLLCAMPPSAAATAFAAELKIRPELCVATFFVLTISCAVTIPILLTILR